LLRVRGQAQGENCGKLEKKLHGGQLSFRRSFCKFDLRFSLVNRFLPLSRWILVRLSAKPR